MIVKIVSKSTKGDFNIKTDINAINISFNDKEMLIIDDSNQKTIIPYDNITIISELLVVCKK